MSSSMPPPQGGAGQPFPPPPQQGPPGQPFPPPHGQQPMFPPPQPPGQQPLMPPPQGPPVQMPPPGAGMPLPPPVPKRKGVPRWLISLIAIIVLGGGVYAFQYFTSDVAQAKAGDCAKVSGTKTKPDYAAVPCDSPDANYIVGKSLASSGSCGGDYDEYIQTGRGQSTKLCLMPNWTEGNCYVIDDSAQMGYPKVACTAPGAVKVEKVVKGKADKTVCGDNALGGTFPEPPTTICLVPSQS